MPNTIPFDLDRPPSTMDIQARKRVLDTIAGAVAEQTRVKWTETAFIKESPGHVDGSSMDIAPTMVKERLTGDYAAGKGSDPVLHLRPTLLGALMVLASQRWPFLNRMAAVIGVENDHLHIQIGVPRDPSDRGRLVVFPFPRDWTSRYADSVTRQQRFAGTK